MKRVLFLGLLLFTLCYQAKSQDTLKANVGFVNRYVWRGQVVDSKPNLQPCLELRKSVYTFGIWGSYNFTY